MSDLFELGAALGERPMAQMTPLLPGSAVSYGKAAIVGTSGDLEHGHAMLHPSLGKAMPAPIGGGKALIPLAAKVAAAGATVDIPLGHKGDARSFDHFDAMSVAASDAPRPDEIMMAIALADGGRPMPRVGKARAAVQGASMPTGDRNMCRYRQPGPSILCKSEGSGIDAEQRMASLRLCSDQPDARSPPMRDGSR